MINLIQNNIAKSAFIIFKLPDSYWLTSLHLFVEIIKGTKSERIGKDRIGKDIFSVKRFSKGKEM